MAAVNSTVIDYQENLNTTDMHIHHIPSVGDIINNHLTQISLEYWVQTPNRKLKEFSFELIEKIYLEDLSVDDPLPQIIILDLSSYLEKYLWINYTPQKSTFHHLISMAIMINYKSMQNLLSWNLFDSDLKNFCKFFFELLSVMVSDTNSSGDGNGSVMNWKEHEIIVVFLIQVMKHISDPIIQPLAMRLVSLPMWIHLSEKKRNEYFSNYPKIQQNWRKLISKCKKITKVSNDLTVADFSNTASLPNSPIPVVYEQHFLVKLIKKFLNALNSHSNFFNVSFTKYCERFVEFMIDLLSQLPTRRFFEPVFNHLHIYLRIVKSQYFSHPNAASKNFKQLLAILQYYENFEIDNFLGCSLAASEIDKAHYNLIEKSQKIAWTHFQDELKDYALTNVFSITKNRAIETWLKPLSDEKLKEFCDLLVLTSDWDKNESREFLLNIIFNAFKVRTRQVDIMNRKSLFPTEQTIWNYDLIGEFYDENRALPLPKLNLQYLTIFDYLMRCFTLYYLEIAYEIRSDIEQCILRLQPCKNLKDSTIFKGWARMAIAVESFKITHVKKPLFGKTIPERVTAEITYNLNYNNAEIVFEWDSLRVHDCIFLVATHPPYDSNGSQNFLSKFGIKHVRGGEICEIYDQQDQPLVSYSQNSVKPSGTFRKAKILLDPVQYHLDELDGAIDQICSTTNVLIRRHAKENNFYSILSTIRNLANDESYVPDWMNDLFLGYGDFASAMNISPETSLNFFDTFLSQEHLRGVFGDAQIHFENPNLKPPYCLQFDTNGSHHIHVNSAPPSHTLAIKIVDKMIDQHSVAITADANSRINNTKDVMKTLEQNAPEDDESASNEERADIQKVDMSSNLTDRVDAPLDSTTALPLGNDAIYNFQTNITLGNQIEFTSSQVQAIKQSLNKGLTLVVGPPGTGKTDLAVQIISNWYHAYPHSRTLIITHSNTALNYIFEKIVTLDIHEKHLLRLGHGKEKLKLLKDYSKSGQIDYFLCRRLQLLHLVYKLAESIGSNTGVSYSIETSMYFYTLVVIPKWKQFQSSLEDSQNCNVQQLFLTFPFKNFFDAQKHWNENLSVSEATNTFNDFWVQIENLFAELKECRPFELLINKKDRGNFILTTQSRIVALTCTHAALKRSEMVKLNFKFDNLLMEEAAQILEIETFIPMLLQNNNSYNSDSQLKRIVLIGDHNQLPPIVGNIGLQKYSNFDQSLFTRLIRLGVPYLSLDAQGRSRSSIAQLYGWKYAQLKNLNHVLNEPQYKLANPGFLHEYQFIDVFEGRESEPSAHFYQNLVEAEYLVAVYIYMRMLGYPAHKISIITSYNGQKHLIRDVIKVHCSSPNIGFPHKVTTVDRYQGQQNDYVLLSLVKTNTIGHIRDVRRWIVALSRAKLGLYIFGKLDLFRHCYELAPTFSNLLKLPNKLALVESETYSDCSRLVGQEVKNPIYIQNLAHMGQVVLPASSNNTE